MALEHGTNVALSSSPSPSPPQGQEVLVCCQYIAQTCRSPLGWPPPSSGVHLGGVTWNQNGIITITITTNSSVGSPIVYGMCMAAPIYCSGPSGRRGGGYCASHVSACRSPLLCCPQACFLNPLERGTKTAPLPSTWPFPSTQGHQVMVCVWRDKAHLAACHSPSGCLLALQAYIFIAVSPPHGIKMVLSPSPPRARGHQVMVRVAA